MDLDGTLARLATTRPGAIPVFRELGLDYVHGGSATLGEACERAGLEVEHVRERLAGAAEAGGGSFVRWDLVPLGDLIDHLLECHHARMRSELSRLVVLAREVEAELARRNGGDASSGAEIAEPLERLTEDLEAHLEKEERILFPMIRAGRGRGAGLPVRVVIAGHGEHEAELARMRALVDELRPPGESGYLSTATAALCRGLAELERDLVEHLHLEKSVLFPRALAEDTEQTHAT